MIQFLDSLFGAPGMLPRGEAMGWDPGLVRLHAVSDAVSALCYLVLPAAILVFLLRRRDFDADARLLGWLLVGFIVVGSLTHLAALLTMWVPAYGLQGVLKAATAVISLAAAVLVWPQLPKLLALPSPGDLRRANAALAQANASLETTIAWRTHELDQTRRRFESALARSNVTVSAQDRDLRYTYVFNPALGLAPEDVIGRTEAEILPREAAAETAELKRRALERGQTVSDTVAVSTPNDGVVYLELTVSPTHAPDGSIDGVLSMTADVTEKRLFEVRLAAMAAQIAAAYRRLELALENSPITVFEQDTDLRYAVMHNPPPGTAADDFVGRTDAEVFSEADQRRIVPPKRRVLERKVRERLEVEIEIAGARRYYDLILEPKLDADGAVEGVIGTALDLTERRRSEQQMRLVMRELTHRSKNLLAVIQAMARKTASLSEDIDSFVAGFSARLRAMAASQDLLVAHAWSGADLEELVRASLAQSTDPASPAIRIDGPPLRLAPDTAQNLGLAFHELTTNAAKHGALSTERGRVEISWRREGSEVRFCWREADGPPVAAPARQGFGLVLLERLVGATLGGNVAMRFRPEGLECEIVFPADRLVPG